MTKTDMHVHSKYSHESNMELEQITELFLEKGIHYVGIADSVELERENIEDVIERFQIRNAKIDYLTKVCRNWGALPISGRNEKIR